MNLLNYLLLNCYVISFCQLNYCFLLKARSIENIKYYIKRHIALLEHCFICKLLPTYLLYE